MRIGEASVPGNGGDIHNGYEVLKLGRRFEVLVPTLVLVNDAVVKMVQMRTERPVKGSPYIRIAASCVSSSCDQKRFLPTKYFRPQDEMRLKSNELPSVLTHTFGLIGMGFNGVGELCEEIDGDEEVGLVVPKGTYELQVD